MLSIGGMLILFGKSKVFLARLASHARQASEVGWLSDSLSCRFLRNSLFNLFSSKFLNSTLSRSHHISGPY